MQIMQKPNGLVLYRGPSQLDGAPIIVIATGIAGASRNEKTGDLIQTWILREDISPTEAVKTGADASICGTCPHRGQIVDGKNIGRSCYVTIFQAPLNVWKSYHRGIYPVATPEQAQAILANRKVRLGSYGDPAAIPMHIWEVSLSKTLARTGYSHAWRNAPKSLAQYVMASCDSPQDATEAKALGYRTFRVTSLPAPQDKRLKEVVCPASKEAGYKTTCSSCLACGGHTAKAKADIVITVHGAISKVNNARQFLAA
jgi:hypothetical protein